MTGATNGRLSAEQRAALSVIAGGGHRAGIETAAWPAPLSEAAFHGPFGRVVRAIEPHSEADPAALLVQLLAAWGNAVGRGPGFQVEGNFHATNLYVVIVGESAIARKGTSWGRIEQVMRLVDEPWADRRIVGGLSSAEGLIWQIRDPITHLELDAESDEYVEKVDDPGEQDKRLLVVEGELAGVLKVLERKGNTLSIALRNLWDTGRVNSMVKNSPARTSGALVSVIGHIVFDELRKKLRSTELVNGFANRFLFVCARRSKLLPDGGNLRTEELETPAAELRGALEAARGICGPLTRDRDAQQLWASEYERLTTAQPGALGAVTARAAAHALRLSVIYALGDQSTVVTRPHLKAALAVVDYAQRSARYIWGTQIGDPLADALRDGLIDAGPAGLSRTDMRELLRNNSVPAREISAALALLSNYGFARKEELSTGGRREERWFAVSSDSSVSSVPSDKGRP